MNPTKKQPGFKEKLHYKFDNLMSAGPIAIIAWLGIISLLLIVVAALAINIFRIAPEGGEPLVLIESFWESLMRAIDAGTVAGDIGWNFRIITLFLTIGGIFIVSMLIGIISNAIQDKVEDLRKGRSFVLESGHTLILGWSLKIFSIISELIIANENQKNARIVILADKDKIQMEDEIKVNVPDTKNTKIICRSGSPIDIYDLKIVNPQEAKSIIIITPEVDEPDTHIIKTILALKNRPARSEKPYHIVSEMKEKKNLEVGEMIGNDEVTIILSRDIVSRIVAQACRQSGLSVVYMELFDFAGDEIYFKEEPKLIGKTFKDSLMMYEDSAILGMRKADGQILLNPKMDTLYQEGDKVIAITEDDDTIIVSGKTNLVINEDTISFSNSEEVEPEKTLLLGWNQEASTIIKELDKYVPKGSELVIMADYIVKDINISIDKLKGELRNHSLEFLFGNICDRETLENLNIPSCDHIILLSYSDIMEPQKADARTLVTLLHLRDMSEKSGKEFDIVSEMMDVKNKELANVTKVDDFIVSDQLISLILSQLSENKELKDVFMDILNAEGSEIYFKPIIDYVKAESEVNFYTLVESASRKNEVALGYKIQKYTSDAGKDYGVIINPVKSEKISFDKSDKIIVLAED
ncbi:MAG: NAD-binding protein [Ignavibacteria bacterium]|nr:NAD-binding protein [Ignavibacteria bacterium]